MKDRNKMVVLFLVALGLSISSIVVLSFYLLDLGTWSWAIGGLVMISCLLTYAYLKRRVRREDIMRGGTIDDHGFQKKERVFNRTVIKQAESPLWRSRVYQFNREDRLKVEVSSDHEVATRLVRVVQGSAMEEIDGSPGSFKKWSKVFVIPTNGEYRVVLDAGHPKVTLTVKIGHRPNGL